MAQSVKIAGALFTDVPSIRVPDANDVYHPFVDPSPTTATDSDVASGKIYFKADGTQSTGTASGGGGGGNEDEIIERSITSITNSTASKIANFAFYSWSTLQSVYFNSVDSIGASAFQSCGSLTTASFPSATRIWNHAFNNCYALTSVSFPAVTSIGNDAFYRCRKLTTASFPLASIIGGDAFYECSGIGTISFPVATSIGSYAFYSCIALTSVSFPTVSIISGYAFYRCSSLATAIFPMLRSGSGVYGSAFLSCPKLESLYLLGQSVTGLVNANAFSNTPMSNSTYLGHFGSIYVRQSLLASWKAMTNWATYSARFVGLTDAQIAALG